MEEKDRLKRESWQIIPLEIKGQEVVQIEYRLPANVIHCTGIAISLSGFKGYYVPTRFGEVSLSFNNRTSLPVHLPAQWVPFRLRMDYFLFKLEEPLVGGTRITGYFRSIVPFPYSVQIYLQCVALR